MPNWCSNKLTVENATEAFYDYLRDNGFSFNKIAPVAIVEDNEKQIDLQVAAWSTKWDLDEDEQREVANELIVQDVADFNTAWSPPHAMLESLSEMFPDVRFRLDYCELGWGFAGTIFAQDGMAIDEEMAHDEIDDFAKDVFGFESDDEEEDDEDELPLLKHSTTHCLSCQENNLFDPEDID